MRVAVHPISVVFVLCFAASPATAYGPYGHALVGEIAERYLCDRATLEVDRLLSGDSLARAAQWPDWIRRDPEWRHTAPWHYINVADDERVVDVATSTSDHVIWATEKHLKRVANTRLDRNSRRDSLRFVAHFVADIHQPLHVGRAADRGGNEIAVIFDGKRTNLHAFWDAEALLRSLGPTAEPLAAQLDSLVQRQAARWRGGDVVAWAEESFALRTLVYRPVRRGRLRVRSGGRYFSTARDISAERVAQAGVRLAESLNKIFCYSK